MTHLHESAGKLILRIVLGIAILLHGIHKLTGGVDWLDGMLANEGLPVFFKYGVYVGEVIAPLLVIAGWYSRIGAWLIAVNMLFAFGLAHGGQLFAINPQSGGLALEAQYMFFFAAIALGLLGPGRYAFNQK
ncbi:MAG TPA: DoxX family protein [Steroidobacteraceae bacterium]|jgi:putative oxidoreductase